jgi:myo-inositol-1(or 4)-monophosphatase
MNQFLEVAIEAAREAGAMLRAAFDRPKTISYKGEVDIVTESDRRAEALIVARLGRRFPDHAIIAEEGSNSAAAGSRYCWHVDPLDGVVFNPIADELFSAARGEGAYLDGKPIRVSSVEKLAHSLVATGFPTHQRKRSANMEYYWEFTLRSHGVRRDGSAALDLCSVACGRFDAFWEFRLNSWDTAAGVVLVREAGGAVTDLAGEAYRPGGFVMLASNGRIHEEMREIAAGIAERAAQNA